MSFTERGVGLSRNNALMRASADICLFADDDIIYENNYKEILNRYFFIGITERMQESVNKLAEIFNKRKICGYYQNIIQ